MATGTCLGIMRGVKSAQIIMDLCTKRDTNSILWDLVHSKIFSKEIR